MKRTKLELLDMSFDDAVKAVMEDNDIPRNTAEDVVRSTVYGGDVVAVDDEDAYNADPDSYIKEQQRKKLQSEAAE